MGRVKKYHLETIKREDLDVIDFSQSSLQELLDFKEVTEHAIDAANSGALDAVLGKNKDFFLKKTSRNLQTINEQIAKLSQ